MIRRAVFVLIALAAVSLHAQGQLVVTGPDSVLGEQLIVVKGNAQEQARAHDDTMLLLADELRYEPAARKVTALGHVVFTREDVRLLADRLVYEEREGRFNAENVRVGRAPYYIEAFSVGGTPAEMTLHRATVSYGEPGRWQPSWKADAITITKDKKIHSENSRVGLGSVQPLPLPRFDQHFGEPLAGAAQLTGGYRHSLGLFADALLLVPVTPAARLGADVGLFTSRGLMVGPAGRYSNPENPDRLRGNFRSGYIADHGDRGTDLLGRPVPRDRAYVEWQHEQTFGEHVELNAQLNWWRDSEVLRDFRPRVFFPVQVPDNFAEATYTGPNYFVSLFTRLQPNTFHRVQQRLPELRFDLLPTAIGGGFYERFNASAAVLRERSLPVGPLNPIPVAARRSDRLDAYYGIERPIAPTPWFSFTPVAGARLTHYANTRTTLADLPIDPASLAASLTVPASASISVGDHTRALGEIGFDAALRASGTFNYTNERWKIDGLRHLFTPRLSYRYIPDADKGAMHVPRIDRHAFSTYLQPLGLGDQRNIDELRPTNTLRLGFDNILQTRDRADGTRDLVAFNVANDFRLKRARGERDVSEIHTELSLTPVRWLQFDLYQNFTPQNFTLQELNSALTLHSGNAWSVRFMNNYLRHDLEDYLVDGRFRINEAYEAVARLQYDTRRHRFNEQAYGIAHNLGNTWLISYTVSLYSGRRRESSFGFNVQIDTVRF